jgi:hypothetical protein
MNLPLILALILLVIGVGVLLRRRSGNAGGVDGRLVRALGGDRKLAKRLLDQARWKYPNQSERWYVEKVIYDLDRDRGRY